MATAELKSIAAECLKKAAQYRNRIDIAVIKSAPWDILEVSLVSNPQRIRAKIGVLTVNRLYHYC